MNRRTPKAVLIGALLAGCAAPHTEAPAPAAAPASATPATEAPPAAAAAAVADSSKVTAADIHFMSGMIGHHAQAITMSKLAPTHGASPAIRTLAARIINAQQDEITLMQQFLREHHQPVPDPAAMRHDMPGMGHDMLMPGMLTEAQMQQLDAARDGAFDELFLKFMMQHHQGAVTMVKDLFGTNGAAQDNLVFKLASDVNVDQTTEIARMQRMLYDLLIGKDDQ
ncbi:MAG TPA: DUF305 domain-containing protein [Longimicrobiales bacterium]